MKKLAAILVLLSVMAQGCVSHWAKGKGTLFESHMYIGRAPMSHQWGTGKPADNLSQQPVVNPNPQPAPEIAKVEQREARD